MSNMYERVDNLEFHLERIKAEVFVLRAEREYEKNKKKEKESREEQAIEEHEKDRNRVILKARIITALNPYIVASDVHIIAHAVVDSILAQHTDVKITFNCT